MSQRLKNFREISIWIQDQFRTLNSLSFCLGEDLATLAPPLFASRRNPFFDHVFDIR